MNWHKGGRKSVVCQAIGCFLPHYRNFEMGKVALGLFSHWGVGVLEVS